MVSDIFFGRFGSTVVFVTTGSGVVVVVSGVSSSGADVSSSVSEAGTITGTTETGA